MRTFFSKETVFSFNKRQTKSVIINHFISFLFVSTDLGVFHQPQLQVLGLISHFLYSEYVDLQKTLSALWPVVVSIIFILVLRAAPGSLAWGPLNKRGDDSVSSSRWKQSD